jgi:drug/metabolite transporter (DMT)-like permease
MKQERPASGEAMAPPNLIRHGLARRFWMEDIKAIPFGSGTLIASLIVIGFIVLFGYQAWMHGPNFVVPVRDMLAVLVISMVLFTIAYMLGTRNVEGTDILLGALIAAFAAIIAFYFNKPPPPPPPQGPLSGNGND